MPLPDTHRFVTLDRLEEGVYVVRNARGGELRIGDREEAFTSVELLLAAIAGCSAIDVDLVTGRRAAPDVFTARVDAEKVRDERGNVLRDIVLTFDVRFPEGPAGDRARSALPTAVATAHDRTCTVSRTIEAGSPVRVEITESTSGGLAS